MDSKNITISFYNFLRYQCKYEETIKADGDILIDSILIDLNGWIKSKGYLTAAEKQVTITRENVEEMFKIRIDDLWERNLLSLKNSDCLKDDDKMHQVEIVILTDCRVFIDPSSTMISGINMSKDFCYLNKAPEFNVILRWNGEQGKSTKANPNSETKYINAEVISLPSEFSSLSIEQINRIYFENKKYVYPSMCSTELTPNQITVQTKGSKARVYSCAFPECFPESAFDIKNPLHLLPTCRKDCIFSNTIDTLPLQLDKARANLDLISKKLKICADHLNRQCNQSESELIQYLDLDLSIANDLDELVRVEQEKLRKKEFTEKKRIKAYENTNKDQLYLAKLQYFQVPKAEYVSNKGNYLKPRAIEVHQLGYFTKHNDIS